MRGLAILALTVGLLAASSGTATALAATRLTISYWAKGSNSGTPVVSTLACSPPRGTLARPRVACAHLATGGWKLFAPVPKGVVCAQIYGSAQVARVVGVVQGRSVWARITRVDGCQIARWSRLAPWLLPAGATRS